jgi:hypothetical protein
MPSSEEHSGFKDDSGFDEAGPTPDERQERLLESELVRRSGKDSGPSGKLFGGEYEFSRRFVISAMVISAIVILSALGVVFFFNLRQ